ncbi:hypothetical protein B5M09_011320 [Aphanomyces astaci]|uniref:beta-glucosidase n=1 Tax=Aphanomyces astaci TaxID=112090 RepID=A0A425DPI7_APHAT|nr:hypothetical protein B5M09_011320 [Aphanomyces astaci]
MKVVLALATLPYVTGVRDFNAEAKVLVDAMSIDEVIGQMTQVNIAYVIEDQNEKKVVDPSKVADLVNHRIGSYLNSPFATSTSDNSSGWNVTEWRSAISQIQTKHITETGHPIIYGVDSVHGATYVQNAVLFPHQINVGATFDPAFASQLGEFAGRDTRAAGIHWIFGPTLEVARHKGWPRIMETFGEDPTVVADMGRAVVQSIQKRNVAACFKHYIGYSGSQSGKDREPVSLTKHELLNIFMPPFKAVIDAGVMTGMDSFIALNGVPTSANRQTSIDLLRTDLKFDGFLVSDWEEIYMMQYFHSYSDSREDSVFKAMSNSSLDMSMVPNDASFIPIMKELHSSGKVSEDRIRTSAQRIVKVKLQLNLYDDPVPGADLANLVGDKISQDAALETAKASLVLVKNTNDVLPLDPAKSFFFTGPSIDDIGLLCGGWTIRWQGVQGTSNFPAYGKTIQAAMSAVVGDDSRAQFYQGVDITGNSQSWDIDVAKEKANAADYTVIALGERSYAELLGNTDPYELPKGLTDYVEALSNTSTKIILVLVEGRPRLLSGIAELAAAVLYAGLPCELGGEAISSVLFGSTNPSGKLPLTYPKSADQLNLATPYYGRIGDDCVMGEVSTSCPVEWHFGHGLSYTSFSYSDVQLSATNLTPSSSQTTVTVTVKNEGKVTGKESVLLFVSAPGGPETRLLKKYTKVELTPGQATDVTFTLSPDDFGKYVNEIGSGLLKEATAGTYYVSLKYDTHCNADTLGPLCKSFTWNSTPPAPIQDLIPGTPPAPIQDLIPGTPRAPIQDLIPGTPPAPIQDLMPGDCGVLRK